MSKKINFSLLVLVVCGVLLNVFRPTFPSSTAAVSGTVKPPTPSMAQQSVPTVAVKGSVAPASGDPSAEVRRAAALAAAPQVFSRFEEWGKQYLAADVTERAAMESDGIALATERRRALRDLIRTEPELALAVAAPYSQRRDLPPAVTALFEERVSAKGDYLVLATLPSGEPAADFKPISYRADIGDQSYAAHVYGRRLQSRSQTAQSLQGIAIEKDLALSDNPLRVLESGEPPSATKEKADLRCPVSKKKAGYDQEPADQQPDVIAESGDKVYYLCSGGHIEALSEEIWIAEQGGQGGGQRVPGTTFGYGSLGPKRLLYIRVNFPDALGEPQSESDAYAKINEVNTYFQHNSYGATYLIPTVTPVVTMPRTLAYYNENSPNGSGIPAGDARAAAKAAGYDTADYDLDAVRYTSSGPGAFSGQAAVGGKFCLLKDGSTGVIAHELGHNLGVWHANYWSPTTPDPVGAGTHVEYGNPFSAMSTNYDVNGQFTAIEKNELDWLPDNKIQTIETSGTYRIVAYDMGVLNPSLNAYSFKLRKNAGRTYYGEFRQRLTSNFMRNGLVLLWTQPGGAGSELIDTTHGTPDGKSDAAIAIGRTFSDNDSDIHFTPIGKGGTVPESLDVVVNIGPFPGNLPPVATLAASATAVPINTPVTFTATASDPNGDPLAYHWDYGDLTFDYGNAATATKSFSTAGHYTVRCVVSDRKGLSVSRNIVVTVGAPTTFTVSGRILDSTNQPVADVRVDNGMTGTTNYRGAYTDSDGYYTVGRLAAGSYTFKATVVGKTLVPSGFTNPIVISSASVTGADFGVGSTLPQVSVATTDAFASEAGPNPGRFTITRTGSTVSALTIPVSLLGSASIADAAYKTSYTVSPPLAGAVNSNGDNNGNITIPAGAASLDLVITPIGDTFAQPPKIVAIELLASASAVVDPATNKATIVIEDDDTTLPTVAIPSANVTIGEASPSPALVTVTRTGSTTASLTVYYTILSATATSGVDYTALSGSVVFPIGTSSASISVQPINDSQVEALESLTLRISSKSAYLVSTAYQATIQIEDDDTPGPATLPNVTITATDATALEPGLNVGTFTVTRTGSTAAPLTVPYGIGGTASYGTDYRTLTGNITIPAGASSAPITISAIDDSIGEPSETVILTLKSQPDLYTLTGTGMATVNITDNDGNTVWLGVTDGAAGEPATTGKFTIFRAGSSGTFTVNYTVSGTATNGVDYTSLSGAVAFSSSDSSKTLTITPIDDADVEDTETVTVTIDNGLGYLVDVVRTGTAVIDDNDGSRPIVSVEFKPYLNGEPGVGESVSTASLFTVRRTGLTTSPLTVHYSIGGSATIGEDYATLPGTLIIPSGQDSADIPLTRTNDALAEGDESVVFTIDPDPAYSRGVPSAVTAMIYDDETVGVLASFPTSTGSGEESNGTVTIPVTLSAPSASPVEVSYRMNGGTATGGGVDYRLTNGRLVFAPGETSKNLILELVDDNAPEPAETILITLFSPLGASVVPTSNTYTYTINTHDEAPAAGTALAFALSASSGSEAVTSVPLTVLRTGSSTGVVGVNYAITGGSAGSGDRTLPNGTLTFADGETSKTIPLVIINDSVAENNETVIVTLSAPSGGAVLETLNVHTYTILNDDMAPLITSAAPTTAIAGQPYSYTVTFSGTPTLTLAVSGLPAWLVPSGNTLSGTPTAAGSFGPITLTASNGVNPSATQSFTITVAPAAGFEAWRQSKFNSSQLADINISGPYADPEGDGLPNLFEYGVDTNPLIPNTAGIVVDQDANGYFTLTFLRARSELLYEVLASEDLATWSVISSNPGSVGENITVTDSVAPAAKRFLRLRVTLP